MNIKELVIVIVLISILAILILLCGLVIILSLCDIGDLMSSHSILAYKIGVIAGQVFKVIGIIWIINLVADKARRHIKRVKS